MIVPKRTDRKVKLLLEKMSIDAAPFFVKAEPVEWALINVCFSNVQKMIDKHGGEMIVGWAIFETNILIEAIFHAVYKTAQGKTVDITPKELPFEQILFVEDRNTPWTGMMRDNFRLNITDNSIVDDLIGIYKLQYKILNYKERAYNTNIKIFEAECEIIQRIDELSIPLVYYILQGNYPNSKCFCGRDKKYFECHGDGISKFITEYNQKYQ